MRKPSAATIMAAAALFISLGGVGVAASGTDFILGRNNTAKAKTSLTAPVAGNALQITNTLPAGSALGLSVDAASPPFTTNSSTKVPNLNSDLLDGQNSTAFLGVNGTAANANKLDGLDSTQFLGINGTASNANKLGGLSPGQFMQGGGSIYASSTTLTAPSNTVTTDGVADFNGLGFIGYCQNNVSGQTGANVLLYNSTNNGITFLVDEAGIGAQFAPAHQYGPTTHLQVANHAMWHAGLGSQGYTIDLWTYFNNGTCTYDTQIITGP
jgi:hypothetical protein